MITGSDVARLAGVSQATVSRALHDSSRISPETKERVRQAATKLGYVPSQHGRALSTRRSLRVGVLVTELANPFYMALLDPIHEALRERGYRTALLTDDAHSPLAFNDLVDGSLDGVIITACRTGSSLPKALTERGVATVTVNRETTAQVVDSCTVENARGAALAAAALLEAGHERIAHIAGPANTSTGRERLAGFRHSLAAHGHRLDPALIRRGEFTFDTGYRGIQDLFRNTPAPDAVFCANDVIAIGALNGAREFGLDVPNDVSIVGFDGIPMAGWPLFDLTTVACDLPRLAAMAVELLVERIQDSSRARQRRIIEPELLVRRTVRGLRGDHRSP